MSVVRVSIVMMMLFASTVLAANPINGWSLYWENDVFVRGDGTDEFYTNGLRLTLNINPQTKTLDQFTTAFCRGFCPEGDANCTRAFCRNIDPRSSLAFVIGHNFYTPVDIENPNPQPLDRAWAGWFYVGVMGTITDANERRQDTFELQAGILGPGAGAAWLQTTIHEAGFSSRIPKGWSNQLQNEPAVNLLYDQARRYGTSSYDFVPQAGFMLGTLQTYGHLGGTVRVGRNITGFPVALIAPSVKESPIVKTTWEAYLFLGGDARVVLHNAFLDGGFFNSGPSVSRNDYVSDVRAGLSVRYKRFRFNYSAVRRSTEFTPQPGQSGLHRFGSFMIGIEPR